MENEKQLYEVFMKLHRSCTGNSVEEARAAMKKFGIVDPDEAAADRAAQEAEAKKLQDAKDYEEWKAAREGNSTPRV